MAGRMHAAAVAARTERIVLLFLDNDGEDTFRPVSKRAERGHVHMGASVF